MYNYLFTITRITLGCIFSFSAGTKFYNLPAFNESLISLNILPDDYAPTLAIIVPVFEAVVGLCILFNIYLITFIRVFNGTILVFTAVIFVKLIEGVEISCGCFGEIDESTISFFTIVRNIILLILGISLQLNLEKSRSETFRIKSQLKKYSVLLLVMFLLVANFLFADQNIKMKYLINTYYSGYTPLKVNDIIENYVIYDSLFNSEKILSDSISLLFIYKTDCKPGTETFQSWIFIYHELITKSRVYFISLDNLEKTKKYLADKKFVIPIHWNDKSKLNW